MRANFSTPVRVAENCCGHLKVTVAFIVHSAPCHVHRFRKVRAAIKLDVGEKVISIYTWEFHSF